MEQVETVATISRDNAKPSWFTNKCRQIVFAVLNRMEHGCLELKEAGQIHVLGNTDASLRARIEVHSLETYVVFIKGGSIGAAEAYIQGQWSTPDLTRVIRFFARAQSQLDAIEKKMSWLTNMKNWLFHKRNKNSQSSSKKNILAHYDIGNDLYSRFLDKEMLYSAAIFDRKADDLESAQLLKLQKICERLELNESDHLLEIGTGWGALAIYAAQNYGCRVTTTTISDAQFDYAQQRVLQLGLADKITLLKQDYRLLEGQYDKLVSVEMIEAVGHEYMQTFFKKCNSLLKEDGIMLLQAITIADQRYQHYLNNVDFIQRYIFPGGCLPSVAVMSKHISESTNMVVDGLHDIGLSYARTLFEWRQRFHDKWNELQTLGYDEEFKRLWHYYLCYCEGAFLERVISTVHLTARKPEYWGKAAAAQSRYT